MQLRRNTHGNRRARAGSVAAPFSGNFADLFPSTFAVWQSDRGLSYGSLLRPNAGNAAATTIAVSGAIVGVPVPIWVVATNSLAVGAGATFDVYYDGLGVTPAMAGLTPTGGATIALTGAGAGLGLTWTAANSVAGNAWKATCAGLLDQSANGKNATQAASTRQPFIDAGPNGKPSISFVTSLVTYFATPIVQPAPATTPFTMYIVIATGASGGQQNYMGVNGSSTIYDPAGAGAIVQQYCGSVANSSPLTPGLLSRVLADFSASVTDRTKAGASALATGASAGNMTNGTTLEIGAGGAGGTLPATMKLLMAAVGPRLTDAQYQAIDAALNSPGGYGPGAIAV